MRPELLPDEGGAIPLPAEARATPDESAGAPPAPGARLASLDAFRGLTILCMLLVNNLVLNERTPPLLTHADWNEGVHLADLVTPWFLFIVGVAIPFSVASARRRGVSPVRYDVRILTRAAMLFVLGCLLDSAEAKQPVFGLGVLQLIGLSYLGAAMLAELPAFRRGVLSAAMLVGYWLALRYLPIPGRGAGIITGEHNIAQHINDAYLSAVHLNGLLSVVPATALVLMGTLAGDLLLEHPREHAYQPVAYLALGGVGLPGLGALWSHVLPFSKAYWTSSYVACTAGWAALVLALFYLLIDIQGARKWAFPLVVFGSNAIAAYVAPILAKDYFLREWSWRMPDGSHLALGMALQHTCFTFAGRWWGGWLYTGLYISVWWLILWMLYRRHIFLRV
ncbi:MAG: DUF5009 domain-containing protein [Armatimonadetes bacterium]|nr:DUF5009 domain-containing protein [Armatimonadota bacterium]